MTDKTIEELKQRIEMFKELMLLEAEQRHDISNETVEQLREIENDITDDWDSIIHNASRLPDGTAVFMSNEFKIYKEDGKPVLDDEISSIMWKDTAPTFEEFMVTKVKQDPNWENKKKKRKKSNAPPTYEEYAELKLTEERLIKQRNAILRFQNLVIGYMKKRARDSENPPSVDEISKFEAILNTGPLEELMNITHGKIVKQD